MNKDSLQDNLYWLFLQASFKAKKGFMKIAEDYDLTFVQLYTLLSMEPGKPLPMNVIAGMLNCDASNVTGIIDRLFSGHYIERQEKPEDRRVKMISLTKEGVELRDKITTKVLEYESPNFKSLSDGQLDSLRATLKQILEPVQ